MKFWQLISVCEELEIKLDLVNLDKKWKKIVDWYKSFDDIVDKQDRSILDCIVPSDLCLDIFSNSKKVYYLSEGFLRKKPLSSLDKRLSVIDIFNQFGGAVLEEMLETGLVEI